jgi:hypothetical protein
MWVPHVSLLRHGIPQIFSPALSLNAAANQINTAGFAYDAAGNLANDTFHAYTYDAEGNVTAVDRGSTAQYFYNALNQRIRTVVGSTATEFVFNEAGKRVSIWNGSTQAQIQGQYYWGAKPVAFYASGVTNFQYQGWVGTESQNTSYNGYVLGDFTSLPFGDDQDAYHFAGLDRDYESDTDHPQFRQYSNAQGRFMSPDPMAEAITQATRRASTVCLCDEQSAE